MLRNLTDLSSVLMNVTRWNGKFKMLGRFVELYDNFLEVVEAERSNVKMDISEGLLHQVRNLGETISEIKVVTKELQRRGTSLPDCRLQLIL